MDEKVQEADGYAFGNERWPGFFWQLLPFALGLLAFELTANTMLGIALACLKFGWEEFLTAIWLIQSDPIRIRGVACASFHVALGFVKTCVTGVAMVLAVLILAQLLQRGRFAAVLEAQGVAALLTISGGGAALAVAMGLGIISAIYGGVRVWVSPNTCQAQEPDVASSMRPADCPRRERRRSPVDRCRYTLRICHVHFRLDGVCGLRIVEESRARSGFFRIQPDRVVPACRSSPGLDQPPYRRSNSPSLLARSRERGTLVRTNQASVGGTFRPWARPAVSNQLRTHFAPRTALFRFPRQAKPDLVPARAYLGTKKRPRLIDCESS